MKFHEIKGYRDLIEYLRHYGNFYGRRPYDFAEVMELFRTCVQNLIGGLYEGYYEDLEEPFLTDEEAAFLKNMVEWNEKNKRNMMEPDKKNQTEKDN